MQNLLMIGLFSILISCGANNSKSSKLQYVQIQPQVFTTLINKYDISSGGNQTIDKTIYSDKAKAYFSLYNDGKITYEIPGVGTGQGTWKDKQTYIELTADTGIFDMVLEIRTRDNENFEFHYRDRHGFNIVNAQVKNVD